jgi:BASS family bile acid:Na+ symporter
MPKLRNYAYTLCIFIAVTAAMIWPSLFSTLGGFSLKKLIVPLLQVIMFGMGTAMSFGDFMGIVRMPKGVLIGLVCQLSIMPLIGFGLARVFGFPDEIAAGIILVGCAPSGLASNVMAYIAHANVPLSITLTAVATLLSPITTPLLMKLLAGQYVPIDFMEMMGSIIRIVILPVIGGLIFNHFFHGKVRWLDRAMPLVSMAGIALIIAIITAAGRDALIAIGLLLIVACLLHNLLGYALGYGLCVLFRMDQRSCRTIAFEVGMQNTGLASGIALEMGRVATLGLAPSVFGPLMNITGSTLATWWRNKPVKEKESI